MLDLDGAGPLAVARHRRQWANASRELVRRQMRRIGIGASSLRLVHGAPRFVLRNIPSHALLVLERGRSRLRHWLFGSTTRWALRESACDVLVV
jgi:nucleotide-binding universal stress UspA family protein